MTDLWEVSRLDTVEDVLQVLSELKGRGWLCRGQSKAYPSLLPLIDRPPRHALSRAEKLMLERTTIELFRSAARYFADPGEQAALSDDGVALMVLRHYGVPTRILDWTSSPWVAAYFAVEENDRKDGEIWAFDERQYERIGRLQWTRLPETTTDGSGDPAKWGGIGLTAFTLQEPPDWFICLFYPAGFHRQNAQQAAYTMTARFARDHAAKIAELLNAPKQHHRYILASGLKPTLREILRERYGVWRGSLFPDSAGVAETVNRVVFPGGV